MLLAITVNKQVKFYMAIYKCFQQSNNGAHDMEREKRKRERERKRETGREQEEVRIKEVQW